MSSMSYCRHENTASELAQVIDMWDEFDPEEENAYEIAGRISIIEAAQMIVDMVGTDRPDDLYEALRKARERE